jgi:hypothetical protein
VPQDQPGTSLPEPRRKEIFLALVDLQDHEVSVAQSRRMISQRFGIPEASMLAIEREGMDNNWPPPLAPET